MKTSAVFTTTQSLWAAKNWLLPTSLKPKPVGQDGPANPRGMDELQAQHAGAIRLSEGRSAAPEGLDGEIRGSRGSRIRMRDIDPR